MTEIKKGNWWTRKTVFQQVTFIIGCILFVFVVFVFIAIMDARRFLTDEVGDALFGPGVANGWVAMGRAMASSSLTWIITLIIIFITFIIIFIGNFITHLFDNRSRKAKTISSLIRSLLKYVIIIAAVCIILIVWGVDVVGIIAGVGVLTLIIGLGCQSLIQDIVSGIFIVFDDYFAVGDTVIIDGFRGTIVEVGLKTTKMQDIGGNIKSITNSSIHTVVNMSRLRSITSVTLSVSYNEDIEHVEALILQEIEELKTKIPNIVDGPYYKGIDNITASSVDFLVVCFMDESNRFQVTRDMKREFFILFKKHHIQIPYTQVTVNPEDDREHIQQATPEEIALAVKEQRKLRGIKEPGQEEIKKKSFKKQFAKEVKKSLAKTQEEMK